MILGLPFAASAQLTDPCEQRGCGDQTVPAGEAQSDAFEEAWLDIGDVDGDGVGDYVFYNPNVSDAAIQVFSGASDAHLMDLFGGPGDLHWFSIVDAGDINGDGIPEIAAGVIYETEEDLPARFAVYDGANGRLFAYLMPSVNPDGSYAIVPMLLTDVSPSGIVDETDVQMITMALADGSDDMYLDMNQDLAVDGDDLLIVVSEIGSVAVGGAYDFSGLIDSILSAEGAVDEPGFETVFADNRNAGPVVDAGPFGCLLCGIRCGNALNTAWDCRRRMWEARCDCFCDEDGNPLNPLDLEVIECLEDVQRNFLPECLQDVIDAVPACAKCIRKCGPKPTGVVGS